MKRLLCSIILIFTLSLPAYSNIMDGVKVKDNGMTILCGLMNTYTKTFQFYNFRIQPKNFITGKSGEQYIIIPLKNLPPLYLYYDEKDKIYYQLPKDILVKEFGGT